MPTAKELNVGDRLLLKGDKVWTVLSCTKAGKGRRELTVANVFGGTFTKVVDGGTEFKLEPVELSTGEWTGAAELEKIGGVELYRQDGDRYVVHLVDEATVAAHLLAFHGVTWEGVTLAEARLVGSTPRGLSKDGKRVSSTFDDPVAERTMTPAEATRLADVQAMSELHERLHAEGDLPVAHTHEDLRGPTDDD